MRNMDESCPGCGRRVPLSNLVLIEPGLKWSIEKCKKCGCKFGISSFEFRSHQSVLQQELQGID